MKKYICTIVLIATTIGLTFSQVKLGDKVPNFSALDQDGSSWVLKKHLKASDYMVIYFYPGAFTGGCTKQACSYRDQKDDLAKVGAQIVGVSGDKHETLGMFALEHNLNFTLLSDDSGEIATLFDVPQSEGRTINIEIKGKELDLTRGITIQRWTFILDQKGNLIYKDTDVNAAEDSSKVVEFLASLQ